MSEIGPEIPTTKNAREAYRDAMAAVRRHADAQNPDIYDETTANAQLRIAKQIEAVHLLEGMRIPVSLKGIREEAFTKTFYPVGKQSDKLAQCYPGNEVMIRHIDAQKEGHARSWVKILEVKPDEKNPDVILARMEFLEDATVISNL